MDNNNAHVDQMGLYHYHGVAKALLATSFSSLIGYAADGFEIHYLGNKQSSSYRLKPGHRPTAPGGPYDGTYNEDWEYIKGSGSLDACNAGTLNGKFVYFATDTYPFFPRCLWGEPSRDFMPSRGGRQAIQEGENMPGPSQGDRPQDDRRRFGPPLKQLVHVKIDSEVRHARLRRQIATGKFLAFVVGLLVELLPAYRGSYVFKGSRSAPDPCRTFVGSWICHEARRFKGDVEA